jgi:hypothetical protein
MPYTIKEAAETMLARKAEHPSNTIHKIALTELELYNRMIDQISEDSRLCLTQQMIEELKAHLPECMIHLEDKVLVVTFVRHDVEHRDI